MRTYSACVPSISLPRIQPSGGAVRIHAAAAVLAAAAGGDAGNQDAVARLERGHAGAHRRDGADPFVTQDAAGRAGRNITLQDMKIGATDRRLGDLHDRIARRGDRRHGTINQ